MNLRMVLLIVVGVIQLAVPGWMVFEQEQTLRLGTEYKFQTAPVDPYDLFRGRYVALRFTAQTVKQEPGEETFPSNSKVYVAVKADKAGFAKVERVSLKPIKGDNVFQAKLRWISRAGNTPKEPFDQLHLEFPFDKYFMEETLAPQAEQAYRAANRRNSDNQTWALVRLRRGKTALVDLIVDGQPIRDYLRDHPKP